MAKWPRLSGATHLDGGARLTGLAGGREDGDGGASQTLVLPLQDVGQAGG